jgi:single-strand DNA-binding protein
MAISVNKATLVGRLGADPTVKGQHGDIVSMSVATSEYWKDRQTGERKERTQWHTVVIFNEQTANFVRQYAKKGDLVYVEGAIETRKWERPNEEDKYFTEIVIRPYSGSVQLMSQERAPEAEEPKAKTVAKKQPPNFSRELDDEIPF